MLMASKIHQGLKVRAAKHQIPGIFCLYKVKCQNLLVYRFLMHQLQTVNRESHNEKHLSCRASE